MNCWCKLFCSTLCTVFDTGGDWVCILHTEEGDAEDTGEGHDREDNDEHAEEDAGDAEEDTGATSSSSIPGENTSK